MLSMKGYQFSENIFESNHSLVFRGVRESDDRPVIIKILNKEFPTTKELAEFKREFKITKKLDLPGVAKVLNLEKYQNSLALIVEDFGAESLAKHLLGQIMPLDIFLDVAIQICKTLAGVHQHNIIHKDLNPTNIVWNRAENQAKIIDFGISSLLSREASALKGIHAMQGTLKYLSPEQTGRMNRALDYRTDLYSLGATFYELLCGRPPFDQEDALEQIHSHIALAPPDPSRFNLHIPDPIAQLILKLLAKSPEDRYQSASGVAADLEHFLKQLKAKGLIQDGVLGRWDKTANFQISEKLYGRENEKRALLSFFDMACLGQPSVVFVSGYSGIGKSALVQEIHKPILAAKGSFITGKFDQFKRDVPYAPLIQAFGEMVRQVLAENQDQIATWKEALTQALGPNGQVMVEVIPEIELITGPQAPVPLLSPSDQENRFLLVFERFVKTFATEGHPLVLFLDDLQWTDSASLKLIQRLATDPEQRHMLIIGAYRSNEVDKSHPLATCIDDMAKASARISSISLGPLKLPHVNQLIAESLHHALQTTEPLAKLCMEKTNGNPFFLNQFLLNLYREKAIEFENQSQSWVWDLPAIERSQGTENVAAFMANRIEKLPEETLNTLKLAACIGNQFDMKTLAIVCEQTPKECAEGIWIALREGYVIPLDDNYKIVDDWEEAETHYRFLHDQIQQAAYRFIASDQRQQTHLHMARLLLKECEDNGLEDQLFEIVNHFNQGKALIENPQERIHLANLNLRAGQKAKLSAAFGPSYNYFQTGLEAVGDQAWQHHYDLMLGLHVEAAETAYLNADFQNMDILAEAVLANAKDLLDRVKIYEIKIFAHLSNNNPVEAVKTGLFILKKLGFSFPKNPGKIDIIGSLLKTKLALRGHKIENLAKLPVMTDPNKLAAVRIMSSIVSASYITKPELFVLITFQQVRLAAKFGNPKTAAFTYTAYGVMLCGVLGDFENGNRFGNMAQSLLPKMKAHEYKAKSVYSFHTFIKHWKDDAKNSLRPLLEAYQAGLETGDLEFAGYSIFVHTTYSFITGRELDQLNEDMLPYLQALKTFQHEIAERYTAMCHQTMLNIMDLSDQRLILQGDSYDEIAQAAFHERGEDQLANFLLYFHKLLLCFLFGNFQDAVTNADKARQFMESAAGKLLIPYFHYLDSLARLALLEFQPEMRREFWPKITANQKLLKKWTAVAAVNHQHKYDLVAAECARLNGNHREAKDAYEAATNHARSNDFLFEEALSFELCARYYFSQDQNPLAQFFLKNAHNAYQRWGAHAKVKDLKRRFFDTVSSPPVGDTAGGVNFFSSSGNETVSEILDLASVMKAAETLSSEIVLANLLDKLIEIAIENAGAQRGLLVMFPEGEWSIETQASVPGAEPFEIDPASQNNAEKIPVGIIQYVQRTQKSLVLQDASSNGTFVNDPYVLSQKPKSILCLPLLKQGQLTGILYLENNLTTNAFTPERLNILTMLSSQAAISLENAHLYGSLEAYSENLEQTVNERTRELRNKNEQLISSIRYAQRIQNATLPSPEDLVSTFSHAFVVYMPRDIVSGDFFWFSINQNQALIAVVDCTGHGVPGALLSMMGHSLLNQIINQQGISSPALILEHLDERIRAALRQEQGADSTDGMELCLCRFDADSKKLSFAGSRRPLYLVRDGNLIEHKGDRRAIGGRPRPNAPDFTQKDIQLQSGDRIYLTTDGYADQASPMGKKYGSRRLKSLLQSLSEQPFSQHKQALINTMRTHRGSHVQVDDITLLGMEF